MTSKQIVRRYLTLTAMTCLGTGLHFAVYVAFLTSHGLNKLEVNLVNLVFFSTLFLFEIPTGAFADVFGRKASYIVSNCIIAIGLFLYGNSQTLVWFMIAEVVLAIGLTFATGAFQAWAVDSLKQNGDDGQKNKLFSKEHQLTSLVSMVAGFLGAYIAAFSFGMPWLVGSIVYALTGVLAWRIMEERWVRREPAPFRVHIRHMREVAKEGMKYTLQNSAVRFIVTAGLLQFFTLMAPNMQWQLWFGSFVSNVEGLGWVWVGITLSVVVGARLAPRFLAFMKHDEHKALTLTQVGLALALIGTVIVGNVFAMFTLFLLHEVARGLYGPVKTAYLHDNIPSAMRATIVSFDSIAIHGGGALGLLVSGFIAFYGSIQIAWIVAGVTLGLGALLLLLRKPKVVPVSV